MKNPIVTIIGTGDVGMVLNTPEDVTQSSADLLDSSTTFSCREGCSDCNTTYLTCTSCSSGYTYISANNNCLANPSVKGISFNSSYLGKSDWTTITFTIPHNFVSGNIVYITLSSSFDVTDSNLS